ncbi:glycosyl transferase family 1 [Chlorobaculum limnaeum]|uniref:Glycosyl transferase family 1 n=1 Tax=Chlorobaculum limnaeum TaxID=274537 RepID=A0A1D8D4K2_CHLLM|nr:glycosyltransferase [Chlorobaculum limnaeum]AOS84915.1 glycosyl transferase family 1 [Chlorobaculum limnaeum]
MRRGAEEDTEGGDLIWFSEIQWDFLSTRKQRLLARFPAEWRILFIEPFAVGRPSHWLPVQRGRVTVVTVPFLKTIPPGKPQLFDNPLVRQIVTLAGRLIAAFWCRVLGFSSADRSIGLSNIYWGGVAASMPCRVRFYDANDDHLGFTPGQPWLRESMRRYLDVCDLVFFVSKQLLDTIEPRPEQRCVELGNGVEFDHFAAPRRETPSQLAGLPKPILGYAGAMDWLDAGLVASVARAWPEYSVVLVGPAYARDWAERHAELLALPNVHWVGKVDYDELPAWVQRFDLALMPLERSPLKRASNPNKLYEYAAAGVPILAIEYCDAVRQASDVAHVASTPGEFVRLVPEALADARKAERQAFARAHSWDALAAAMVRELRDAMQRRRA